MGAPALRLHALSGSLGPWQPPTRPVVVSVSVDDASVVPAVVVLVDVDAAVVALVDVDAVVVSAVVPTVASTVVPEVSPLLVLEVGPVVVDSDVAEAVVPVSWLVASPPVTPTSPLHAPVRSAASNGPNACDFVTTPLYNCVLREVRAESGTAVGELRTSPRRGGTWPRVRVAGGRSEGERMSAAATDFVDPRAGCDHP